MSDLQNLSAPLWTGEEALAALSGLGGQGDREWQANGVSIDTRNLKSGDLFVALPGEKADGHDYVESAFAAGASAALVRQGYTPPQGLPDAAAFIYVDDVAAGLEALGQAARARSQAHILAVTGSVGKTSVKEALRLALSKSGSTHASEKSYNNHIGVPLSLARLPREAAYGVFEIGMNHAGEIATLVEMVRPHTAIITHIGSAHIEHLGSEEAIARAKAEIFTAGIAPQTAIIPQDTPYFDILRDAAKAANVADILPFAASEAKTGPAVAWAEKVHLHDTCSCVSATIDDTPMTFKVGTPGRHQVSNALAVLTAVKAAGADLALAALSLAESEGLPGRGQRHVLQCATGDYLLIDESYNANPSSMQAALMSLGLVPRFGQGRRIAALGDMAELGEHAADMHQALAENVEQADIDLVVTCGVMMQHLHNHLPPGRMGPHVSSPEELLEILLRDIHAGDVIMVKGANATGMMRLVDGLIDAHGQDAAETMTEGDYAV